MYFIITTGFAIANITSLIISLIAPAASSDQLVINEVFYDPPGTDSGCFIELKGTPGLSLNGYYLTGINGGSGKQYCMIDLAGYKVPEDGFFVIAQDDSVPNGDMMNISADLQNGPDSLELWFEDEKIDSIGYGDFSEAIFAGEGYPALDLAGYSVGRRPDGMDTDDNSFDFVGLTRPSPGLPNGRPASVSLIKKLATTWGKLKSGNL